MARASRHTQIARCPQCISAAPSATKYEEVGGQYRIRREYLGDPQPTGAVKVRGLNDWHAQDWTRPGFAQQILYSATTRIELRCRRCGWTWWSKHPHAVEMLRRRYPSPKEEPDDVRPEPEGR
jgi:hypothetical protein